MSDGTAVTYRYDGSFDGLMCCVFESYYRREKPAAIFGPEEGQLSLFRAREIVTDPEKAARVKIAIAQKVSGGALQFIRCAHMSCMEYRDEYILRFVYLAFREGRRVMQMLTNEDVAVLSKAVLSVRNEAELLRGFVRFSDYDGGLAATITPKNSVLPLLKSHFRSRYPDGSFMIYDRTHSQVLLCGGERSGIFKVEGFTPPEADEKEIRYRELWRRFYNTIAVEGRENPRCRMNNMPKRYWRDMTEHQTDGPRSSGRLMSAASAE